MSSLDTPSANGTPTATDTVADRNGTSHGSQSLLEQARSLLASLRLARTPEGHLALDGVEPTDPLGKRLLCLALLLKLEDRGFDEAVQSLRDMVDFYAEPWPEPTPPPTEVSISVTMLPGYIELVPAVTED